MDKSKIEKYGDELYDALINRKRTVRNLIGPVKTLPRPDILKNLFRGFLTCARSDYRLHRSVQL